MQYSKLQPFAFLSLFIILIIDLNAQNNVGIGTNNPDNSAALEIQASDKGLLIPRMSTSAREAINNPAEGLMVYDTVYSAFFYHSQNEWKQVSNTNYVDSIKTLIDTDEDTKITVEEVHDEDHVRVYAGDQEVITATSAGEVFLGHDLSPSFELIHSLESWDNKNPTDQNTGSAWQSFELTEDQIITDITLFFESKTSSVDKVTSDVIIYDGIGTGGSVLYQSNNVSFSGFDNGAWISTGIPYLEIKSGEPFTIYLSEASHWLYFWDGDPHPIGETSLDWVRANIGEFNYGFLYRMYAKTTDNELISVKSNGLVLGDYTLPYEDGNNGEALVTDGSGSLSWQAMTDNQSLSISGDDLSISGGTGSIDLSPYLDNTDNQSLSISNDNLSISGASGSIPLSGYLDNTDNQSLSISNHNLSISGASGSIPLSGYLDNTDNQSLSISNHNLSISGASGSIPLSGYLDNTDEQSLSISNHNLSISGASGSIPLSGYLDNTDNQSLSISNNSLSISGTSGSINLSSIDSLGGNTKVNGDILLTSENMKGGLTATSVTNNDILLEMSANAVSGNTAISDAGGVFRIDTRVATNSLFQWYYKPLGKSNITSGDLIMQLDENGNLTIEGSLTENNNSDARLKTAITPLNSQATLDKLLSLQGVSYLWNDDKTGKKRPEGIQYGFTAQNIQSVYPELVSEDRLGYLVTAYGTYDAMYIEAFRALNDKIKALESENNRLKAQIHAIPQEAQTKYISNAQLSELVDRIEHLEKTQQAKTDDVSIGSL